MRNDARWELVWSESTTSRHSTLTTCVYHGMPWYDVCVL